MEKIELRARWGPRKEPAEACAAKLLAFLQQLATCDTVFAQWFTYPHQPGTMVETAEEAMAIRFHPVELSLAFLQELISRGRFRRERDKSVIEDLGFATGTLWNGSETEMAHVSVQCGAYPDPWALPAANAVRVNMPNEGQGADRLLQPENLLDIMTSVIKNWDPDWTRISTNKIDGEIYPGNPYLGQMVGWFTYVSDRYGQLPKLPTNCQVTRVENRGHLVVIDIQGKLTASNPAHLAAIAEVSEILKQAGLLAPIPPSADHD